MSVPLYVPVLPAQQHAVAAYRGLLPGIRRLVAPLWTVRPCPANKSPERWLPDSVEKVTEVMRHGPGWLDAPFTDQTDEPIATCLRDSWTLSPLRPVTGPGRTVEQQTMAVDVAVEAGRGLGVRVRLPGAWDDELAAATSALIERTGEVDALDLLLDLDAVLDDRPQAGKEAVRALDALVLLADWRCVVAVGGAFPQAAEGPPLGQVESAPRDDWDLWHEIRHSGREYARLVGYGDYGALQARHLANPPASGRPPPWGVLRYTAGREFLITKVPTGGPGRADSVRAAARRIVALDDFRGPEFSEGERWLWNCAHGSGRTGTGSFGTWNQVGNTQHLAYVVHCLRGPARP